MLTKIWSQALAGTYHSVRIRKGNELLVDINPELQFSSASIIKLFLAELLVQGKEDLTTTYTVQPHHRAPGDGILEATPGTTIDLRLALNLMLSLSDNTATNLIIDHLGGVDSVNTKLHQAGYRQEDVYLCGTVGGKERAYNDKDIEPSGMLPTRWCLGRVAQDAIETCIQQLKSDSYTSNILATCQDNRSIARDLPTGIRAHHKTGTADGLIHDVGWLSLEGADLYISVLTDRPGMEEDYSTHTNDLDDWVCKAISQATNETLQHVVEYQSSV